jgi:hypothetical protein
MFRGRKPLGKHRLRWEWKVLFGGDAVDLLQIGNWKSAAWDKVIGMAIPQKRVEAL